MVDQLLRGHNFSPHGPAALWVAENVVLRQQENLLANFVG